MNACPTNQQLQDWLADRLSAADSRAIETHVESCTDICQPLLDSLSGFEDDELCGAGVSPAESAGGTAASALAALAGETPAPQGVSAEAGETPAPQSADWPHLPGYDILGPLGRGGMGVVYKARHRRMDRLVAIKVLPPGVIHDAAAVARFEREVRASARLHHPHIVAAYDAAEADGVHFLVMEYVAGTDLAALVRQQGPLAVERAVEWVLQAARGLDYAHRHGVVHRDIKPSNLLVDREGVVKVLDMGLARFESSLGGEQTDLTSMGQIMGTVDYMAPEQALDTHHADARSDIYSLGMTLWYLLTGRPAYTGESALARLLAHREQPVPSLRAACPSASPEMETVFSKMVAKQPGDRYQTMSEVIAALEDGLPRPSSISTGADPDRRVGTAHHDREQGAAHHESGGGHCPPYVAVQTAPARAADAPDMEATLTLGAAQLDTDPHTEQSLDLLASALHGRPRPPRRKFRVAAALAGLAAIAAAAAFVVRVQTDTGEVVVESEVDGISVDIVRDGQPVKEDWQIHAGDNRWAVRTGTVNVRLPASLDGEFTLDQDNARLIRDGKILVKITRKKKSEATAIAAEDRDRAAAEWVVQRGGIVDFITASGKKATANRTAHLPAESLKVQAISLWNDKTLVNADLDRLAPLDLGYLVLSETDIDSGAIPRLISNPLLGQLHIDGTRITSSQLSQLAPLRRLFCITLSAREQNDDAYAALAQLPSLRQLILLHPSAEDIRQLASVKQLRTLWLRSEQSAEERAVADLHAGNPLCRVLVGNASIRAVGRDLVAELARGLHAKQAELELVDLATGRAAPVSGGDDIAAGRVFDIGSIKLTENTLLGEEEIRWLECPCSLWMFSATRASGADRYVAAFKNHPVLSSVSLQDSDLTDAGLERLKTLPSLVWLDVRGTKVTKAGVEKLQKALPDCKILWEPPAPTAAPVEDHDRAVAEWVIAKGGKVGYNPAPGKYASAKAVDELPPGPFKITEIILEGVKKSLVSSDFQRLPMLTLLDGVQVNESDVDPDALSVLARIRSLSTIAVGGTRIKTSDLGRLADSPKLTLLKLQPETQNDDAWEALVNLPRLRQLTLYGPVWAADMRDLGKVKQLRTVWLTDDSYLDEQAVADMQRANPLCRVLVGMTPVRSIGRDCEGELAKRLLGKKVTFEAYIFPGSESASKDEVMAGKPLNITSVRLPEGVSLDDDELTWLTCASLLDGFIAQKATGANRYASSLRRATHCWRIGLAGSDLTDAGLRELATMPSLRSLDVRGTKVTATGVESLQKALPECKIRWEPSTSTVPAKDRDRAAAEWVLAQDGKVVLLDGTTPIEDIAELPLGPLKLGIVNLEDTKTLKEEDLDRFAGLDRLYALLLRGTPIGPAALQRIRGTPSLDQLYLERTGVTTSAFTALQSLPRLRFISISARQADDGWDGLRHLRMLRRVTVYGASSRHLDRLADFTQLRDIWLPDSADLDAQAIAALRQKNPLCRLIVGDGPLAKAVGADHQRDLAERLQERGAQLKLEFWQDPRWSEDIRSADRPVCVRSITLPPGCWLGDDDFRLLTCLTHLQLFEARTLVDADRYAEEFDENDMQATWIDLSQSDLTDAGLARLAHLPVLELLKINGTRVTLAGVEAFKQALPQCDVEWNFSVPAPTVAIQDRDRAVAEWVLAQGGKVGIRQGMNWPPFVERAADLPVGPFALEAVNLSGCGTLRDEDLSRFVGLDDVNALQVDGTSVGPAALEAIARTRGLERLLISGTKITTSALAHLRSLPRLHSLWISTRQVDDDWQGLRPLRMLRYLELTEASSDDLKRLAELPQLRTIYLPGTANIDQQAVAELQRKNPLCRVVAGDYLSAEAIGEDHERTFVERLQERGATLKVALFNGGYSRLTDVVQGDDRAVRVLDVVLPPGCSLFDDDFPLLSCLTDIKYFEAPGMANADRCAAAFDEQHLLAEWLKLPNSDLTDAGLAHLAKLPRLESLDVRGTKVTLAGVEAFKKALPDCKTLWEPPATAAPSQLGNRAVVEWVLKHGGSVGVVGDPNGIQSIDQLPDGDFEFYSIDFPPSPNRAISEDELIAQLRNVRGGLTKLEIHDIGLTDAGMRALAELPALAKAAVLWFGPARITDAGLARLSAFANLSDVGIRGQLNTTPHGIAHLRALPGLKSLELFRTSVSDAHVAELRGVQLEHLSLVGNPEITDAGMADLAAMRSLRSLNVAEAQVTDAGLARLRGLKLQWLDLASTRITDAGLSNLSEMHTLRHLKLWSTRVGDAGLRSLRGLNELEFLDITATQIGVEGLAIVPEFQKLQTLCVVHLPVTDELLAKFSDLPALKELHLGGDKMTVSVAGLSSLARADNLRKLWLGESNLVTDDWLEPLGKLTKLAELDVTGTKVTRAGVEKLQKALTDCKIAGKPPAAQTSAP